MSSALSLGAAALGAAVALGLGIVHFRIPAVVRYPDAIGTEAVLGTVGRLRLPLTNYDILRSDLVGLTWVMSNAATYVLLSIAIVDLGWLVGRPVLPVTPAAWWIAGWWLIRAASQLALGHRRGDLLIMLGLSMVAAGHVALALES